MKQVIRMTQTEAMDIIANSFNVESDKVNLMYDVDYRDDEINKKIIPFVYNIRVEVEIPTVDQR